MDHQYRYDIGSQQSGNLGEKIAMLRRLADTIQELETSLAEKRAEYNYLKQEIESIESPISHIGGLPSELLSDIFVRVCREGKDRREVAKMRLVCRRWNEVVKNTSIIWTQVHIDVNNDVQFVKGQCGWAELCSRLSEPLPLEVKIDFTRCKTFEEGLADIIIRDSPHLFIPRDPKNSWGPPVSVSTFEGYQNNFENRYQEAFLGPIGPQGQYKRRWKSLVLNFPEIGFSSRDGLPKWAYPTVKSILSPEMTNISRLTIMGTIRGLNGEEDLLRPLELPALTSLTIPTGFPLTKFSVQADKIVELSMGDTVSPMNFYHLCRFQSLQKLTYRSLQLARIDSIATLVELPLLEDLSLLGSPPSTILVSLKVPKLKILRIGFDWFTYRNTQAPEAPFYSQVRTIYFDTFSKSTILSLMPRFLNAILPHCTSATHIYITTGGEQILMEAIKKVKMEDCNALPSFMSAYGYDADGSVLVYEDPLLAGPGN